MKIVASFSKIKGRGISQLLLRTCKLCIHNRFHLNGCTLKTQTLLSQCNLA
uniref:Uncharacterized protein n=1 Tax=Arundo donax TaxID=35708 RepID=A0A0A8ZDJ0_ARUDO